MSTKGTKLSPLAIKKLLSKWLGLFEVTKRVGEVAYELVLPASMGRVHPVFHVSLLRKYQDGKRQSAPPPAVLLDGEEECEIQQVLAHRQRSTGRNRKHQLESWKTLGSLVSWKGMGPEHSEWKHGSDLTNAAELVQDCLNTLGPNERPAARVGRPAPPAAEPVVSGAEGTPSGVKRGKRGHPRSKVQLLNLCSVLLLPSDLVLGL